VLSGARTEPSLTPQSVLSGARTEPSLTPQSVLSGARTEPSLNPQSVLSGARTEPSLTPQSVLSGARTEPSLNPQSVLSGVHLVPLVCVSDNNVSRSLRSRTPGALKPIAAATLPVELPLIAQTSKKTKENTQANNSTKPSKRTRTTKRTRAASYPRVPKSSKQQHEPEETPQDNTPAENIDIAEAMSDHSFLYMENVEHRLKKRPGASKKDCFTSNRKAAWLLDDFLDNEELVYIHLNLARAADTICALCDLVDPVTEQNGWSTLENNEGKNDNLRKYANHCLENDKPVHDIVMNFVYLVKEEECIGAGAYACGGNGREFSITLLIALVGARRQRDHTDYDADLFQPYEEYDNIPSVYQNSYLDFNGASMFINFSWNNDHKLDLNEIDNKSGQYRFITLPAMSIVIISGDLIHAGSANSSGAITRKFFLYLDPHPLCRNLGIFKEGKNTVNDNHIWFGDYYKLV
jgi:hypothetical protein